MRGIMRLAVCLLLLAAGPALAADGWYGNTAGSGDVIVSLDLGEGGVSSAVFFLATSTTAAGSISNVLVTEQASTLELSLVTDTNGTAGACELRVYETFAPSGSAVAATTGLPQISADVDGDGVQDDLTLNGSTANRRALRGFSAYAIAVEVVIAAGSGEQCALKVQGRR